MSEEYLMELCQGGYEKFWSAQVVNKWKRKIKETIGKPWFTEKMATEMVCM